MSITAARKRALEAVRDGKCFRKYTRTGNTLHGPKGVAASTLWYLANEKMIEDDPRSSGNYPRVTLTKAGKAALSAAKGQKP